MIIKLNKKEINALLTNQDLMINYWDNNTNIISVALSYLNKLWPGQIISDVSDSKEDIYINFSRLFETLGYDTLINYNRACILNPTEVLERIYKLKCPHVGELCPYIRLCYNCKEGPLREGFFIDDSFYYCENCYILKSNEVDNDNYWTEWELEDDCDCELDCVCRN